MWRLRTSPSNWCDRVENDCTEPEGTPTLTTISDDLYTDLSAVTFDSDGDYAYFSGTDPGPSTYPQMTMVVWIYLHETVNERGWIFGDENGGCDRYILLHDNRVGGLAASCKTNPGLGNPQEGKWLMVAGSYDQAAGSEYTYYCVDGSCSSGGAASGMHSDGFGRVEVGNPAWTNHYAHVSFKNARIFDSNMNADEVQAYFEEGPEYEGLRNSSRTTRHEKDSPRLQTTSV